MLTIRSLKTFPFTPRSLWNIEMSWEWLFIVQLTKDYRLRSHSVEEIKQESCRYRQQWNMIIARDYPKKCFFLTRKKRYLWNHHFGRNVKHFKILIYLSHNSMSKLVYIARGGGGCQILLTQRGESLGGRGGWLWIRVLYLVNELNVSSEFDILLLDCHQNARISYVAGSTYFFVSGYNLKTNIG